MIDMQFDGPNKYVTTVDGTPFVFLWRPHVYLDDNGIVQVYLACSIYKHPLKSGDSPLKLFHVKPGGQILEHEEGGTMTGGPVVGIFADDIVDIMDGVQYE